MTYMWTACCFTYFMIGIYVKYLPGSIFINTYASGVSEAIAYVLAGIIYGRFGFKCSFTLLYAVSCLGGLCILFFGTGWVTLMPIFVVIAKFGISGGYTILYVSTNDVFPVLFCSTAIGMCNFISRILTIFSAEIAEVAEPWPMILFSGTCFLGILFTQFIRMQKNRDSEIH